MDTLEEGSLTSSMVDDAFFVVKKCTRYFEFCAICLAVYLSRNCVITNDFPYILGLMFIKAQQVAALYDSYATF